MKFIANWDVATAREALLDVKDPAARDLCSILLRADPMERRRVDLAKLLATHPFFVPKDGGAEVWLEKIEASQAKTREVLLEVREKIKEIRGLALETKYELSRGLMALKRRIGAASEITVPTVFVIKPKEEQLAVQSIQSTAALFGALQVLKDPVGTLKEALGEDKFELWLCCELCYTPQTGETGKWPYPMRMSSARTLEFAARVLPLARAALQVAVGVNGFGGIGRLLGLPVPQLSEEAIAMARNQLGFLEQETSVADFRAMEKRLHEAADKAKLAAAAVAGPADATKLAVAAEPADAAAMALEGPALREFERFLDEHDPNRGWCGLSPVFLDEGVKVFCCGACCKALEEHPTATFAELRKAIGHPRVATAAPPTLKAPPDAVAIAADADATPAIADAAAAALAAFADAAAAALAAVSADADAAALRAAAALEADRTAEMDALRARVTQLEARPAPRRARWFSFFPPPRGGPAPPA
ncbi:hypothetical protein M885DRAFT_296278 [Pelagophyceae sp. CCMP2097]|nr:hypothetical protein M885DRAFT_296278 [Pelagophyceae sp. CCMP2097]